MSKRKLCHYMSPLEGGMLKNHNEKDCKLIINWNVTSFVEGIYHDNKRLIEENAVLRERERIRISKNDVVDVVIPEAEVIIDG